MHIRFSGGGEGFDPFLIAAVLAACLIALVALAGLVWD